jgi:hypothetical protein
MQSMISLLRQFLLLGILAIGSTGCSRLQTEYGHSQDAVGRKSIAGFGVLRQLYRQQGWQDRTVARLSERLNNVDAIVWTPDNTAAPTLEVTEWFEEWLERDHKTLVYVLRDYETEDRYWTTAAQHAPPSQRLVYRRRAARVRMEKTRKLLERPTLVSNGWFTAIPHVPPVTPQSLEGSWATAVQDSTSTWHVDFAIRPYDQATDQTAAVNATTTVFTLQTAGTTETPVQFEPLLLAPNGSAIIAKIHCDQWKQSQIIVVASGSLLNNFAFLDPASRQLATQLLSASQLPGMAEKKKVGFLVSGENGVAISSLDPENNNLSGLDIFFVWPMNLILIHGFFLGLAICLRLWPIFGRPKRLPTDSSTDFADHIRGVANLMSKTRGEQYARVRISEYMVRVRGEQSGPWVLPAAPEVSPAPSLNQNKTQSS